MKKKLLFFFELSAGHLNVLVGLVKTIRSLYQDKYEIYFLVDKEYKEIVSKKLDNINYLMYSRNPDEEDDGKGTTAKTIERMERAGPFWKERDRIKFNKSCGQIMRSLLSGWDKIHPVVTKIMQDLKPDLIIIDLIITVPTGTNLNIPYVNVYSGAPNQIGHRQLPPPRSGLPTEYTEENIKKWNHFIKEIFQKGEFLELINDLNKWMKEENSAANIDNRYFYTAASPYLNIYNYPLELDFVNDKIKLPGNFVRIDSAIVDIPDPFPVPEKLKDKSGKLVYFSLGSMASCYKPLMDRLLKIFSEINHRFIISLGIRGDEFKLSNNQYGEKYINQLAVLQTVDVFISHGGNNSLSEAFHIGTPLIILPLFADQYDNARRTEEKGYSIELDPFSASKEDFEKAIDLCLNSDIRTKIKSASERIKKDNNLEKVCKSIISLIDNA